MSFADRVQDVVNSLNQGVGLILLRGLLFLVLVCGIFGFYAAGRFRGLKDPGAMDAAQVARNLAEGRGFTTSCIRPADFWCMDRAGYSLPEGRCPELRQSPLYPFVLSACFRAARPLLDAQPGSRLLAPEKRVIVPLGIVFSVATGALLFLLGRRMFGSYATSSRETW